MLFTKLFIFVTAATAASAPAEFRYFGLGKEIRRGNLSVPITFNGIPIAITELDPTATNGTIHSLADGHHFRHRGWVLSDKNGGAWEYSPRTPASTQKRSPNIEPDINLNIHTSTSNVITGTFTNADTTFFAAPQGEVFTEVDWEFFNLVDGNQLLDLFDDGAFLTTSTAVIGELFESFFDAISWAF
ncbi:hypothetical protein F5884DRAFT_903236 [Xylogone sp. PMI_703]|nr:hypothetical protein F5884DRAFT_903236 [Xylogone sp. PMI_703]